MVSRDEIKDIVREVIREELSLEGKTHTTYRILDKKSIELFMKLNEEIIGNSIRLSINNRG